MRSAPSRGSPSDWRRNLQIASPFVYQGGGMAETSDYSQVIDLLRAESEAIAKAASRLRAEEVDRVVAILARCRGKIVVLGVGKSGIIAHKIAATMKSSCTAAGYLHPSDALHGGPGCVQL